MQIETLLVTLLQGTLTGTQRSSIHHQRTSNSGSLPELFELFELIETERNNSCLREHRRNSTRHRNNRHRHRTILFYAKEIMEMNLNQQIQHITEVFESFKTIHRRLVTEVDERHIRISEDRDFLILFVDETNSIDIGNSDNIPFNDDLTDSIIHFCSEAVGNN